MLRHAVESHNLRDVLRKKLFILKIIIIVHRTTVPFRRSRARSVERATGTRTRAVQQVVVIRTCSHTLPNSSFRTFQTRYFVKRYSCNLIVDVKTGEVRDSARPHK